MTLTNDELLARFAAEHFERNSISAGRRARTISLLTSLSPRLEGRTLIELTPSDLMAWQGAELARGLTPNTVRNLETMIRAFITWAHQSQLMSFELSSGLKSVTPPRGARGPKPKPYKRPEIEAFRIALQETYPLAPSHGPGSRMVKRFLRGESRLVGAVYRHARRLQFEAQVALALEEGLRRVELWALTIPALHPDNSGVVVFNTAKGKPGEIREREVPYTAHARMCVAEWLEFRAMIAPGHDLPWLKLKGSGPRDPQTLTHFGKALRVFGPPPCNEPHWRWHRFRHTFATERLRAGMPLEKLQVMMGHANLAQTLAYAEIVNSDVSAEAARTEDAFARNIGVAA